MWCRCHSCCLCLCCVFRHPCERTCRIREPVYQRCYCLFFHSWRNLDFYLRVFLCHWGSRCNAVSTGWGSFSPVCVGVFFSLWAVAILMHNHAKRKWHESLLFCPGLFTWYWLCRKTKQTFYALWLVQKAAIYTQHTLSVPLSLFLSLFLQYSVTLEES